MEATPVQISIISDDLMREIAALGGPCSGPCDIYCDPKNPPIWCLAHAQPAANCRRVYREALADVLAILDRVRSETPPEE